MKTLYCANAPMTAQAAKLGLTAEEWNECRVVYEKDKNSDGYVFHSLWTPGEEYGGDHIIMPVGSVYGGVTDELAAGTEFANVSQSSYDRKCPAPGEEENVSSWMELMNKAYEHEGAEYDLDTCCAERNVIYNSEDGSRVDGFTCTDGGTGTMQGAHVFIGETRSHEAREGSTVYLLPLCIAHNVYKKLGGSGMGYYMRLERRMKAVVLNGYMPRHRMQAMTAAEGVQTDPDKTGLGTENTTVLRNRKIEWIVIHYTAGSTSKQGSANALADWFRSGKASASSDYIVDDCEVVLYNPDIANRYSWGVGGSKYNKMSTFEGGKYYGKCTNKNCINIEVCSNKKNTGSLAAEDRDWFFTGSELDLTAGLVKMLMQKYGIDSDHVIMHHHVTGKLCPAMWCHDEAELEGWKQFKERILQEVHI